MRYDKIPDYHAFDRVLKENTIADCPLWLQQAVEQKNPRLTIELANSVTLIYDDLDIKLFLLTGMN